MNKLAWLGHYTEPSDIFLFNNFSYISKIARTVFCNINKLLPPYIFADVMSVADNIELYGILCPLFPSEIASMSKEKQINTIKKMIQISNKLGLSQIGIAGIFASIWEDGEELKNFTDVPITTGKNLIAALVKEYISRCRRVLGKGDNGTLGVIGYGKNRLSGIFLDTFNAEFGEVLLDGEDQKSREIPNARRETTENIFKKSDMIILTVMGVGLNNYIDMIRPGSVICDLIVPFYLSKEISKTRKDLLAFEGVWSRYAKMEQYVGRNKKRLFKNNIVPACVAELIILSLENKFGEYSLADNINHRNALDMLEMSKRNGFDFFGFKQGMNIYSREDLERITNVSKG